MLFLKLCVTMRSPTGDGLQLRLCRKSKAVMGSLLLIPGGAGIAVCPRSETRDKKEMQEASPMERLLAFESRENTTLQSD